METRCMNTALEYAKRIAYSTEKTLQFSYDMAVKFKNYPGCYVECGCAAGAQVIAMASANTGKKILAFDSFSGIPMPSNRDDQMPGIAMLTERERKLLPDPGKQVLESSGATVVSLEDFCEHLNNSGVDYYGLVIPVRGWFEETIPKFVKDQEANGLTFEISILRLDGDLYNSTWVCLQHLFPKVIKGGCVIIDDIQLTGCKAAIDEYFQLIDYSPDWEYVSNIAYFYK